VCVCVCVCVCVSGRGSVLLQRRCHALCASGFVYDYVYSVMGHIAIWIML